MFLGHVANGQRKDDSRDVPAANAGLQASFPRLSSDAPQFRALEAAGAALNAALVVVRAGCQQHEEALEAVDNSWRSNMAEVAKAEEATAVQLLQRCEELAEAESTRRFTFASIEARKESVDKLRVDLAAQMLETSLRAELQVPLEVGSTRLVVSARSLRRSPWFSRRLHDLHLLHVEGPERKRARLAGHGWQVRSQMLPPIKIERDGTHFLTIMNFLRMGPSSLRALQPLPLEVREALLQEATFYELRDLAGLLAEPAVGNAIIASVLSHILHEEAVDVILAHELCESWHAPGKCFDPACRRRGRAQIRGLVVAYSHSDEPQWQIDCRGTRLWVRREQLQAIDAIDVQ